MNKLKLDKISKLPQKVILPVSKSIANRWLLLQALYPEQISIQKFEDSEDTAALKSALAHNENNVNVGHAGTAMRFFTAFAAIKEGEETSIYGSKRMHQRPIKVLVDALQKLGADIEYLDQVGFPPLRIQGKALKYAELEIDSSVSSQFISALILIAPKVKEGLKLKLTGTIVSRSYINLTLSVLHQAGIAAVFENDTICISEAKCLPKEVNVVMESDWSAASFWYAWVAVLKKTGVDLLGLKADSLQGDKKLIEYFETLNVRTKPIDNGLRIYHVDTHLPEHLEINLINQPDLAQPLAVTCSILGVSLKLNRLQTLLIKETNRLLAIQEELKNFGISAATTHDSISIAQQEMMEPSSAVKTYDDHRMAMSFSLFASKFPIEIENPSVVRKSYPDFFDQLLNTSLSE